MEKQSEKICICSECPTYTLCAAECGELFYCYEGNSPNCISIMQVCICPNCNVWKDDLMKKGYYCVKGSESMLTGDNAL